MKNFTFVSFIATFLLIFSSILTVSAQSNEKLSPVKWDFTVNQIENEPHTYEIVFNAQLDAGWYIYSQNLEEGGPLPTEFSFDTKTQNAQFLLKEGSEKDIWVQERGEIIEKFDELFEMTVRKYSKQVQFVAFVKAPPQDNLTASVRYMACNAQTCLPPTNQTFNFDFQTQKVEKVEE